MPEREVTRRGFLGSGLVTGATLNLGEAAGQGEGRKTLLAVEAHMDDVEWGAGGTLFKAVAAGYRVVIVQAVSDYTNWPPTQGREKTVEEGVARIAKEMGVEKIYLGYKYHHVPADNDIKCRIAEIAAEVEPDIALVQADADHWTDHANIARAGKDGILFAHGYLGKQVKRPSRILAVHTGQTRPMTSARIRSWIPRMSSIARPG